MPWITGLENRVVNTEHCSAFYIASKPGFGAQKPEHTHEVRAVAAGVEYGMFSGTLERCQMYFEGLKDILEAEFMVVDAT